MRYAWLLALLFVVLAGCRPPRAAVDTRTTVTWMVPVTWLRPATEKLVADFEREHPAIKVRLMWVPAMQYQTKFKILAAAGQPPDLVETGDVWAAYMLPFLMDISDLVERDRHEIDLDDFYPQVLDACRHQGRYYFLANSLNLSLLYYNKTIFTAAGVPFPTDRWTWDDYLAAGQRLTQRGPGGQVETWGSDLVGGWWGEWLIYVRQAGGRLFTENLDCCLLDTPESLAGLRLYNGKVNQWGFAPRPGHGPSNGFASGRLAMLYGGHVGAWRTYNAIPNLDWDIQVLPIGPAGRRGGEIAMGAYGITKGCRQREAAWTLLKHIVSKPAIREHVGHGTLSVRKSVASEVLLDPARRSSPHNIQAVYAQLPYAEPIPRSPDYIEVALEIIQPEIDLMIQGEITPEEAGQRATLAANRFLAVVGSRRPTAVTGESQP